MATAGRATETSTDTTDEVVNTVVDAEASAAPGRFFTIPGRDPFEEIEWELRDAVITNERSEVTFEQRNVEVPRSWSQASFRLFQRSSAATANAVDKQRFPATWRHRPTSSKTRGLLWWS